MKTKTTRLLSLAILFCATFLASSAFSLTQHIKIPFNGIDNLNIINELSLEIINKSKTAIELHVSSEELELLIQQGLNVEIIHENVAKYYESELQKDIQINGQTATGTMGGYKTISEVETYLDSLRNIYPLFISEKVSIGQSHQGRDIWAVKVSLNPDVDENEPEILLLGGEHANQVMTTEVVLYLMNYFITHYSSDTDIKDILQNSAVWIIPVLNPDGY